jgi:tetratricopeptide (TPR) repeat protein
MASLAYAARRGVDLWAEDPAHLLLDAGDERAAFLIDDARRNGRDVYVAAIDGDVLIVRFPLGKELTAARLPLLEFHSVLEGGEALVEIESLMAEARRQRMTAAATVEARVAAAMARADAGEPDAALGALVAMPEQNDPRVLVAVGLLYQRGGRDADAARHLGAAALIVPNLLGLQYNLGLSLWRLSLYGEARRAFEAAVVREESDAPARFGLGSVCLAIGDPFRRR